MHTFVAIAVSALLSFTALVAQGEVEPRIAAKKGNSVWLVHESTTEAKIAIQGQDITTSQRTARTLHLEVKDVAADGALVVETTLARVHGKLTMAMGQGDFDFDSAADDAPSHPMARHAMAGAGKHFVARVSANGERIELGEGAAAILDANKEARGSMHQLTEHGLRQLVADTFGMFPPKRTAGGAQWDRESTTALGRMVLRQKVALTLADVAPEAFVIEGKGTTDLALDVVLRDLEQDAGPDKEETKRQLESTKAEKGTFVCKQKTSRADGFVLESSTEMQIDLVTGESQMGEVTTKMASKTTVARITAEQALPKKPDAPKPDGGK